MNVILFGASGMVGMGVLREALADAGVEQVLYVGRSSCGVTHAKLREVLVEDLFDIAAVEGELTGWDACLWAVGISSVGLSEAEYARVTEELTLKWARALLERNPGMSFCYCSGAGADGKSMWARVRQRVEAELKKMPFRHVGVVRPAFIQPGPGIQSRVKLYRVFIVLMRPVFPLMVRRLPQAATTSERLGRAMLRAVEGKAGKYILESADINRVGGQGLGPMGP